MPATEAIRQRAETQIAEDRPSVQRHNGVADVLRQGCGILSLQIGQLTNERRSPVCRTPEAEYGYEC